MDAPRGGKPASVLAVIGRPQCQSAKGERGEHHKSNPSKTDLVRACSK